MLLAKGKQVIVTGRGSIVWIPILPPETVIFGGDRDTYVIYTKFMKHKYESTQQKSFHKIEKRAGFSLPRFSYNLGSIRMITSAVVVARTASVLNKVPFL